MNEYLNKLFRYSHHMNAVLIQLMIKKRLNVSEQALSWMSHIINAHQIWNERIQPEHGAAQVWEVRELDKLLHLDEQNFKTTMHIIEKNDLQEHVDYTNSKGDPFSNTIQDILFHVINHTTHHRAQISSELRRAGIQPPITDYIFYLRKGGEG